MNIRNTIKDEIKKDFDIKIVLIQIGFFFEVVQEDAIFFVDNFDFKLQKNGLYDGDITGFPEVALDHYKGQLQSMGVDFCIVSQVKDSQMELKSTKSKVSRVVSYSTIKEAEGLLF